MIEIADELERLAEEFRKKRDSHNASAEMYKRDPNGLRWQEQHEIAADAWGAAAAQLRARAAELRAQRSAPTYKPQPKPAEVRAGQWWSADNDDPRRVVVIRRDGHDMYARCGAVDGVPIDYYVWEMLNSSSFLYLGDGPEPAR